jgi:murein tripeptide amidase MpaA
MPQIDFSHYYTYDQMRSFLDKVAREYPELVTAQVIGRSFEDREIVLATLTNRATGPDSEKPAYWIDANTHAGEVTGSAVALFTVADYASRHGRDERVTRLLDNYAVYVVPRISVDGSEHYLTSPNMLRSSKRRYPYDEDRDGLHPEDIDGDGRILQMRVADPDGAWKAASEDPRVMVRRGTDDFGGTYYHLVTEGIIKGWDGQEQLASPRFGLDLNRNYPFDWAPEGEQKGSGDYPFSEPETRTLAQFWATHRNISCFVTYHTYSGVLLRPYSTHPDDHFDTHDLEVYKLMGERGTELTGYPSVSVFHGFAYDPKQPMHGAMDDYAFDYMGWFGFTDELWSPLAAAGIETTDWIGWLKHHSVEDDLKMLKWNDEKLGGKGFTAWHEVEHPQLGRVEVGGWDGKRYMQNAPPEELREICERSAEFTLAHALMSPRIYLKKSSVEKRAEGIYALSALVANEGFLPTYTSKRAQQRKLVRPLEVKLELPEGATLVTGKAEQEIGHLEGRSAKLYSAWFASGTPTDNQVKVEWVVNAPSGGKAKLTVKSERAGTLHADFELE